MTTPPKEEARELERVVKEAADMLRARGWSGRAHELERAAAPFVRPATLPPQHSSGDAREPEESAWNWLEKLCGDEAPADRDWSADQMVDAFIAGAALSRQVRPISLDDIGEAAAHVPLDMLSDSAAASYRADHARQDRPEGVQGLWTALATIVEGNFNCSPHQRFMAAQGVAEQALAAFSKPAALGSQGRPCDHRYDTLPAEGDEPAITACTICGHILDGSQDRPAPEGHFRDLLERFVESIMDGGRCKGTTLNINHEELKKLRDDAIAALASRSAPDGGVLPAELRELSEKATAGEWLPDEAEGYWGVFGDSDSDGIAMLWEPGRPLRPDEAEANAKLIAAAVNFVRSLAASPSALDGEEVK